MGHAEIMAIIPDNIIDTVSEMKTIIAIKDIEERKRHEALAIWPKLPHAVANKVRALFNVWMGIPVPRVKHADKKMANRGAVTDEKINIKSYSDSDSNYVRHVEEKDICSTRLLTCPILSNPFNIDAWVDTRGEKKPLVDQCADVLCDMYKSDDYRDMKTALNAPLGKIVFHRVYGERLRRRFVHIFMRLMSIVFMIFILKKMNLRFPTFHNIKNLCAYVILDEDSFKLLIVGLEQGHADNVFTQLINRNDIYYDSTCYWDKFKQSRLYKKDYVLRSD
jgi:hypothetical protein